MKNLKLKLATLISLLFVFGTVSNSQFVSSGGPNMGGYIYALAVSGQYVYAGTQNAGFFYSTNNGSNWVQSNTGIGTPVINVLAASGNYVFAGTSTGLYKSTNNGISWANVNFGGSEQVNAITISGTDVYLGAGTSVYKGASYGTGWSVFVSGLGQNVYSLLYANGVFYVGGVQNVWATSDGGVNWHNEYVGVGFYVKSLYASGTTIRAGVGSGGFKNTSPLGGWVRELPWSNYILGFAATGSYILMGSGNGIFWSSNFGANWNDPNYDFMNGLYIWSMAQNGEYIYAGTGNGIVFRRPVSELNGLTPISNSVPMNYSLSQNYPNPFNPSTNIELALPKSGFVSMNVYNELGQKVAELANQNLTAGSYKYSFDASALPSGVYFYKMIAGDFFDSKKMLLVK